MSPAPPGLQDQSPIVGKPERMTVTNVSPRVHLTKGLKREGKKERE